jgi:hypothetical protein
MRSHGKLTVKVHIMGSRVRPRTSVDWLGVYKSTAPIKFALTDQLKEELCEVTALEITTEEAETMLEAVREELSMLPSAKIALDRSPRPAHKLKLLDSVVRRAKRTDLVTGDHSVTEDCLPQLVTVIRMASAETPVDEKVIRNNTKKTFVPAESASVALPLNRVTCMDLFKTPETPFDEAQPDHCCWLEDCWVEDAYLLARWPCGPLAWEFHLKGFPEDATFEFVRQNFIRFAELVQKDLRRSESWHGPMHKALKRLIVELSHIFDLYAYVLDERDRRVLKAEFVSMALSSVGFPRVDPKKLRDRSASRLVRQLPKPCIECIES